MNRPWMKFYPSDWRADPALRMCSIAARGLWVEMICLMHEATPRGSLRVKGQAISEGQLAVLAGIKLSDVCGLLAELETAGVLSRDDDGTIFSRRMRRDEQKAERDKANGATGGNPALKRAVNTQDKAQTPEARVQNPEREKERFRTVASATVRARARKKYDQDFEEKFWQPYPRTPVMSKAEAWKTWMRLSADERNAVVAAVPRYATWLQAKPDHPVVHACRFISQRRFEGFCAGAETAAPPQAGFPVAQDTPEWAAWWAYYETRKNAVGKSFGQSMMTQAKEQSRAFPASAQWPPGWPAEQEGSKADALQGAE